MKRRSLLTLIGAASLSSGHIEELMAQPRTTFDIPSSIEQLAQVLGSDFAKAGLESAVRAVYSFRRQARPAGYEGTDDWEKSYAQVHQAFQKHLWSANLGEVVKIVLADKETLTALGTSYQKNRDKFLEFSKRYAAQQNAPVYLRVAPDDLLVRAQLYFAAVLRGAGQLKQAVSVTAVWPFCG